MKKFCRMFALGVLLLSGVHSASAQQIFIEGVQVEPTAGECIRAIERGVQIDAQDDRRRGGLSYFVFDGRLYLIMIGHGNMTCVAWEM